MTKNEHNSDNFETRAIHAGQAPDPENGAVMTPVYLTSTFKQDAPAVPRQGYEYSRTSNPTRTALEENVASLEGGAWGLCFASGLSATNALLATFKPGDHIVAGNDLYGGTHRIFRQVYERYGIEYTVVDARDTAEIAAAIRPETQCVYLESPSNPLLRLTDLSATIALAKEAGKMVVVDNTFATPYLQQPISLGADAVVHSATKYLGGHSDVVGGVVVTSHEELAEHVGFVQNAVGAVAGPFDSYLVLRGMKTLAVRMDRHCANAAAIVDLLNGHNRVSKVLYPGLKDHPGHDVAVSQMANFGGMVSFRLVGGREAAEKLAMSTRVFTLAESLGAVESLIEHPGVMTHASAAGSALEVPDDLIRVSVGIESVEDLVADLERALATV